MKTIGIVTDSHCGISNSEAADLGIKIVPMPFFMGDTCYYEGVDITREEFFDKLRQGMPVSTSQPSPEDVMKTWDEMLEEYETILYIPLSSGLSGSCMVAAALAQEEKYEERVFVVDNGRASTPLHRSILDAAELIEEGYTAEQIKKMLEDSKDKMSIYVGLSTLENLKRGGRIKPAVATIGAVLNIKPIMKLDVGVLDIYKKCRGFSKAKAEMINAMKHDMETRFKEEYENGEVYLMAASSASEEDTKAWVEQIEKAFPGMPVMCDYLTFGLSCHIGPDGLGIGCSCKPKRI